MQATAWRQFDDVVVKPDVFVVEKAGRALALEPKSIRVLMYLIESRPRAVSKDELLRHVWEDVAVTDNALTRVVAQLRKALGDDAKVARYIETVPTLGYRFIADVGPVASVENPSPAVTRPPARRRWRDAAAVAALGIVCLAAGALWQAGRREDAPAWSGTLLGGSVIASHPRISPDGQLLAFRAIVDGQSQVAVMKPDAASWTVLTHDRGHGAVACIAWARDESKLYFDREWGLGRIYSIGPLGGEPRLLLENAARPEPLPDGSLIVERGSSEGHQQLLRFWPDSGRLETLPAVVLGSDLRLVHAFPDGKEIAVLGFYRSEEGPPRVFALDLSSGKARFLAAGVGPPTTPVETVAVSADGQTVFEVLAVDDSKALVAVPRDGSRPGRVLFTFPSGASPLSVDPASDGSIYLDQSGFESTVIKMGGEGKILSEDALPKGASHLLSLPSGRFAFGLVRGGRPQILIAEPGGEPRSLLNTNEPARFPGAPLGSDRLAFVIGAGEESRLAIASIADGRVLRRFEGPARWVSAVAASPDARTIYYCASGVVWAQSVDGGPARKAGEGFDVTVDPAGKFLYMMRAESGAYRLVRTPLEGGDGELMDPPSAYQIPHIGLSPAAVSRDGRILLPISQPDVFFYRAAIFDPARHSMTTVPAPQNTVLAGAGWTSDGNMLVQVRRWSSTLWRYRKLLKN